MKTIFKYRQNGFAIIEALIAFLLLGIGVAALLYLQGNLMGGSSLSKARAEAMELAKDRTEELRNYIDKEQYLSALGSVSDESETGVNATYTVSYTILQKDSAGDLSEIHVTDNPLTTDKTQNITVTVIWPGSEVNSDSSPKMEEVSLETMLYYTRPEIASAIADQGNGEIDSSNFKLPSPWLTGVEKEHTSTGKNEDGTAAFGYVKASADDDQKLLEIDEFGDINIGDADIQIVTYSNSTTGLSNVEVVHDGVVKLTSFGGIVHKLKGEIILHQDADTVLTTIIENFQLLASPPSYCVAPICADGDCKIPSCDGVVDGTLCNSGISTGDYVQYISYICYVPGDCTNQDDYVTQGGALEGCQAGFKPPPGKDLNGGWYGRIGNFNLFLDREKDMVCTAGATSKNLTPSREYVAHRWEECVVGVDPFCTFTPYIAGNKGINRPFDCNPNNDPNNTNAFAQTFIIAGIVRNDDECRNVIAAQYKAGTSLLFLPPENVIRTVGESGVIPSTLSDYPLDPLLTYTPPELYPYPPLTDLVQPVTEKDVVLGPFEDYCIPAPPVIP